MSIRKAVIVGQAPERQRLAAELRRAGVQVLFFADWLSVPLTGPDGVEIRPIGSLAGSQGVPLVIANGPMAVYAAGFLRAAGRTEFLFEPEYLYRVVAALNFAGALPALGQISSWLADDDSRRVFANAILYRQILDGKILEVSPYGQYFHPLVKPEAGETALDVGAYDGATARSFAAAVGPSGRVYAFEPSPGSFATMKAAVEQAGLTGRVELVQAGSWSSDGRVPFSIHAEGGTPSDGVVPGVATSVPAVSLDSFCRSRGIRPSLIKMDVEGSELESLKGAAGLLRECHPKLQISLYHKMQDLWEIPLWLQGQNLNYRMYIGHHYPDIHWETVLYAV